MRRRKMNSIELDELVYRVADYYINNQTTVRKTSAFFGLSRSTVHNYLTKKLFKLNKTMYLKAQKILKYNFKIKCIRGGAATKKKYEQIRKNK